jgi:hypothetical protein
MRADQCHSDHLRASAPLAVHQFGLTATAGVGGRQRDNSPREAQRYGGSPISPVGMMEWQIATAERKRQGMTKAHMAER